MKGAAVTGLRVALDGYGCVFVDGVPCAIVPLDVLTAGSITRLHQATDRAADAVAEQLAAEGSAL